MDECKPLEHGASLVPVYAFGETDLYHTSNFLMVGRCRLTLSNPG